MSHKVFSGLTSVTEDQTTEAIEVLNTEYDPTFASKSVYSTSGKIWVAYNITAGSGSLYLDVEWSPDGDVWMEQTQNISRGGGSKSESIIVSNLTSTGGPDVATVTVLTTTDHKLTHNDIITVTDATGNTAINNTRWYVKVLSDNTFELYSNADLSTGAFQLNSADADAYTHNSGTFYNGRVSKVDATITTVDVQMDSDGIISQSSKPSRSYVFDVSGKFVRLKCKAATSDSIVLDAWIGAI